MCEALIRVVDKALDPDPAKDALISKRGHVVTVRDDDWPWSQVERENPEWVIFYIPGVPAADYAHYVGNLLDPPPMPTEGPAMLARREFSVDLSRFDGVKDADGTRRVADPVVTREQFDAAKVQRPRPTKVEVIG